MDDGRIIPDGIHFVRRNPPGGLKVGDGRLSGMGRSVDTFTIHVDAAVKAPDFAGLGVPTKPGM